MKNVNVYCEFWRVINTLKYLGYDILAHSIDSTNKCCIICKRLANSLRADVTVDYTDEWYWNPTTDEDEHLQGFNYEMRVNDGFWYSATGRQDLFERLKEVSEHT